MRSVTWSPSGRRLAVGSEDGRLRILDVTRGFALVQEVRGQRTERGVRWDPGAGDQRLRMHWVQGM